MQRFKFRLLPSLAAAALALSACDGSSLTAPVPAAKESAFHASAAAPAVVSAPRALDQKDRGDVVMPINVEGDFIIRGIIKQFLNRVVDELPPPPPPPSDYVTQGRGGRF